MTGQQAARGAVGHPEVPVASDGGWLILLVVLHGKAGVRLRSGWHPAEVIPAAALAACWPGWPHPLAATAAGGPLAAGRPTHGRAR